MAGKGESETAPTTPPAPGKPANKGAARVIEPVLIALAALLVAHTAAAVADMRWGTLPLSIAAAVLVFPLLPVAWHLWGERRLKRKLVEKEGKKAPKTTRRERFAFRLLAVTAAVGIGLVLWVGISAITALRHHSTWMLPVDMRGESCQDLATTYRQRLEETGGLGLIAGDTLAGFGQARLHHRCEAASWTLDERRCVLRAMESEQLPDKLYAAGYLRDCGVGGRELKAPEPADAPSCKALGERAVRSFGAPPGEKLPAGHADTLEGHVAETCEKQGWKPLTRRCLDVGWRYGRFIPCKHEGAYVELELPAPEAARGPADAGNAGANDDDTEPGDGVAQAEVDDPGSPPPAGTAPEPEEPEGDPTTATGPASSGASRSIEVLVRSHLVPEYIPRADEIGDMSLGKYADGVTISYSWTIGEGGRASCETRYRGGDGLLAEASCEGEYVSHSMGPENAHFVWNVIRRYDAKGAMTEVQGRYRKVRLSDEKLMESGQVTEDDVAAHDYLHPPVPKIPGRLLRELTRE